VTDFEQENDLPLGDDCAKYLGKELKPSPALSISDMLAIGLGIMLCVPTIILCLVVFHSTRRLSPIVQDEDSDVGEATLRR
jgi:hypothetical protein